MRVYYDRDADLNLIKGKKVAITTGTTNMQVVRRYNDEKSLNLDIRYLDLGGGLGIPYNDEEPPHPADFGTALTDRKSVV